LSPEDDSDNIYGSMTHSGAAGEAVPPPRPNSQPPNADGGELYGASEIVPRAQPPPRPTSAAPRAAPPRPPPAAAEEDDGELYMAMESTKSVATLVDEIGDGEMGFDVGGETSVATVGQRAALTALAAMVSNDVQARHAAVAAGAVAAVAELVQDAADSGVSASTVPVLADGMDCLASFYENGKPRVPFAKLDESLQACQAVLKLPASAEPGFGFAVGRAGDLLELFSNNCDESRVQAVLNLGVVARVIEACASADLQEALPHVKLVGNLVSGSEKQTQVLVDAGVVAVLSTTLAVVARSDALNKAACFALSNVAAGTDAQSAAIVADPQLIPRVAAVLGQSSSSAKTKTEALHALQNICDSDSQAAYQMLMGANIVSLLCANGMQAKTGHPNVALETLFSLLEWGAESGGANPVLAAAAACNAKAAVATLTGHPDFGESAKEVMQALQ